MKKNIIRAIALIAVCFPLPLLEVQAALNAKQYSRDITNNSFTKNLPISKLEDSNAIKISYENSRQDNLSTGTQQILGFLSGGFLGVIVAPLAYGFFGGNIIIWAIAGAFIGGFLWNLQLGLLFMIGSFISKIISKIFKPEEE